MSWQRFVDGAARNLCGRWFSLRSWMVASGKVSEEEWSYLQAHSFSVQDTILLAFLSTSGKIKLFFFSSPCHSPLVLHRDWGQISQLFKVEFNLIYWKIMTFWFGFLLRLSSTILSVLAPLFFPRFIEKSSSICKELNEYAIVTSLQAIIFHFWLASSTK